MGPSDAASAAWSGLNKAVVKGTKKAIDTAKTVGEIAAINTIPTGKAASVVGKIVSRTTAGKLVEGEAKTVVRKFVQGKGANIVEEAPKKFKEGPKSPVKGTKVTVVKETKAQTPLQQSTVTVGRIAREGTKKAGAYAKGAATGAIVTNEVKKGTQANHAVTDNNNHTRTVK